MKTDSLIIEPVERQPSVFFNAATGIMTVRGESVFTGSEDALKFWIPIIKWFKEYEKSPAIKTVFNIKLRYYCTSSSFMIFEICRIIEKISKAQHKTEVNWFFESGDEDMQEAGEDFSCMVKVPFNIISYLA